jgi:hypothetical protein
MASTTSQFSYSNITSCIDVPVEATWGDFIFDDQIADTKNTQVSDKDSDIFKHTVTSDNGEERYYGNIVCGLGKDDDVTLHFDGLSIHVSKYVLGNFCPVFESFFYGNPTGESPQQYTIEKYSKEAVMKMLWHLHGDGDAFDQSKSYKTLSEDDMSSWVLSSLRHHFEIFCMANEYELPKLRSEAQANIMAIRRRAMELKDNLYTSVVLSQVLSLYEEDRRLDPSMFNELASQCLAYECLEEDHHFWMFRKINGVWVTEDKQYQRLVKKLNELDNTGMVPIPVMISPPKSEVEMWTW